MGLFEAFQDYIQEHSLVKGNQRVLLAISGGVDSVVMAHLFSRAGIGLGIAHCNFRLRPGDAEKDQQLVEKLAQSLEADFFSESFDTLSYSKQHGISIQMAARQLRYQWLEEVRQQKGFEVIATGHHLDDSIETLLINLSRGTGLRGLKGIPRKNDRIIRPLLFATREEIEAYATENNVEYRQDLSNLEIKYLRNKIRHKVIPVMQKLNPSLHKTMHEFFEKMADAEVLLDDAVTTAKEACITPGEDDKMKIAVQKLKELSHPQVYLYEFLKPLGFSYSTCRDIAGHLDSQPGRMFFSPTHGLVKDREHLLAFRREEMPGGQCMIETHQNNIECAGIKFIVHRFAKQEDLAWPADESTALLDYDRLVFPLLLRPWKAGDSLVPLGMKGRKKVSDLLTDKKIPLHEKPKVMVLISGKEIVWVAGLKVDNRFRITKNTKMVFSIKMGKIQ